MQNYDHERGQRFVTTDGMHASVERANLTRLKAKWEQEVRSLSARAAHDPHARAQLEQKKQLLAQVERQIAHL